MEEAEVTIQEEERLGNLSEVGSSRCELQCSSKQSSALH